MKRYDLIMHMSPRELGFFIADKAADQQCEGMGPCQKYLSCAGCYWTWINREISVRWCTNCQWYDGASGKCECLASEKCGEFLDYNDTCEAWFPADWWTEPELKHVCRTCNHHDDYIGACVCGDSEYRADFTDDDDSCKAWEPKKGMHV